MSNKQKVIDINDHALVRRQSTSLADHKGEWLLRDEEEPLKEKDSVYKSFRDKISRIKRLSEEEEYALGMRVMEHNDPEAKKKLVLHNMRLALKMAHQYKRDWTNFMDLVQEASAGMAIAAKKWDPRVGTRFGTYAAYWIRAQLNKFLMTNARLIHTGHTRTGRKLYSNLPQIQKKLLLEGKNPTPELIAKEMGEDPKEVGLILDRLRSKEASLSTPLDEEGTTTLEDTISISSGPDQLVSHNEIQAVIKNLTESFEKTLKDERDLAIWRENLIASDPINLVELGKRYNVSKQRMGQLATRLKRAFRCHIIDKLGPKTQVSWLFRED